MQDRQLVNGRFEGMTSLQAARLLLMLVAVPVVDREAVGAAARPSPTSEAADCVAANQPCPVLCFGL